MYISRVTGNAIVDQSETRRASTDQSGDGRGVAGDPGPQVRALLGHGPRDGGALHLALVIHNHAGVVLKISSFLFFSQSQCRLCKGKYAKLFVKEVLNMKLV